MKLVLDITDEENARAETCLMFFPYHGKTRGFESKKLCTCCLMPRLDKCDLRKVTESGGDAVAQDS